MSVRVFLLLIAAQPLGGVQQGADYLQTAIRDLSALQAPPTNHRRAAKTQRAAAAVPQLTLTKGELAALYEAAVAKGNTVNDAAVHEIDEPDHPWHEEKPQDDDVAGYYYYYYPIKSFMDELNSEPSQEHYHHPKPHKHHHDPPSPTVSPQYHHHEHNVHIAPMKAAVMEPEKKKGLEPLFMAISGFIGMAVMFVLSALVLPKLGVMKSREKKPSDAEITAIARIALQAIEGKECAAERLACELGKTARGFSWYDNRFFKFLRRIAPVSFGRQIDKVGKYADRKRKCAAIQCKRKNRPNKKH